MFGGTGRTGRFIVQQALAAGHEVTAFARNPDRVSFTHERLRVVRGDVLGAASVDRAVQGHDVVLSALGTPARGSPSVLPRGIRHILDAMEAHGMRRIVCMSAAGALHEDTGSVLGNAGLGLFRLFLRGLYLEHGWMLAEIGRTDVAWTVVRPVLLTNGPRTGRYRVALEGIPPRGFRISRADVADFMIRQLASEEYVRQMPAIAY